MSPLTIGLISIGVIFIMVLLGVHVGIAVGSVGFVGCVLLIGLNPTVTLLSNAIMNKIDSFDFVSVLFFTWAGMLAASSGLSERLFKSLSMWLGKIPGGLGIALVWCCAAFGTVCSSCMVTAMIFAKIAAPELRKAGYDKRLTYGICASAGNLGQLIPPSTIAIIYGVLTEMSIGSLLIAGITPGIVLAIIFSIQVMIIALTQPDKAPRYTEKHTWKEKLKAALAFIPFILIIGIVLVGIYTGFCSISESAALCVVCLMVAAFIAKVPLKDIFKGAKDGLGVTAMSLFLIVGGAMLSRFMTLTGAVRAISDIFISWGLVKWKFLLAVSVLYLFLGCFLDSLCQVMLTVPIFFPMLSSLGVSNMQFSVVMLIALHVGMITPPFGMNVFGIMPVAEPDVSMNDVFGGSARFLISMVIVLVLFCFIPVLSEYLPAVLGYGT